MSELSNQELDDFMSEIGMRIANETVGKPLDDDDLDDILVSALAKSTEAQRVDIVDNMFDILSITEIIKRALSDDGLLDADELGELQEYLREIEGDTKEVIQSLATTH